MVKITPQPLSPESVANQVKTRGSGCAVTYVGLIRDTSRGRPVAWVEYSDPDGTAAAKLEQIVTEASNKWRLNEMAIYHRTGRLKVGDINLVVAVAAAHRREGFAACQYAIDQFKEKLPTRKKESYLDDSCSEGD
jgi:molybdopterin synthase catalytic subunit